MAFRLTQTAFVGGVLAPSLFARADLDKYAFCLKTAKNVICTKTGSVMNRAGTVFVGEVRDSSKVTRLINLQFNTEQNYVIELNDAVLRPIKDGGQVLRASIVITAATAVNPSVFNSVAHGASIGDPVFITGVTGLVDANGVSQINDRVMLINTVPTVDSFTLKDLYGTVFDASGLSAYASGGTIARLYQLTIPYASTEIFGIGYAQTADTIYACHQGYAVRKITRSAHDNWSINTVTFGPTQVAPTGQTATATVASGVTVNSYKITAFDEDTGDESLPTASCSATNDLTVAGNYNTIAWTGASGAERYNIYKNENGIFGFIGGTTDVSFKDDNISPDLGDTPPAARNPFGSSSNYPATCDFHEGRLWFANTINTPGGVWSSQSNRYENLNVSAPAKADDAVSFQLRPGVNAVRSISSVKNMCLFTSDAEHTVKGGGVTDFITPASIVVARQSRRGSASIDSLVVGDLSLFIQRQGGAVRAFGYSFQTDNFKSNDLTLLAPHLFAGYTIVDWCYQQEPYSIVWVVRSDGALLSLTFVEEQNISAWAIHYLGGTFGSGADATGFGVAESCTCIEGADEDEVYLVVKRTINGQTKRYIEKLAPRWNGDSDDIRQAYFVDCGLTYTSAAATSIISELWHLEAQIVTALVDGNVQGPFTVTGGQITLSLAMVGTDVNPNSQTSIGLAYVSDIEDLPVSTQSQAVGAPNGRVKTINAVVVKLRHSRGMIYGDGGHTNRLAEMTQRQLENWSDPMTPYDGDTAELSIDGGWTLDGTVFFRQARCLPMEVVGSYKDLTMGG